MKKWLRFSLRTMMLLITALCIWLGMQVNAAQPAELTPDQAAAEFLRSVELIRNYDIQWTATMERTLKLVSSNEERQRLGRWRPFEPGETPQSRTFRSRQIADGPRYRIETLDPETGSCTNVQLSNGTTTATWEPQGKVAFLMRPSNQLEREGVRKLKAAISGDARTMDYKYLYCNVAGNTPLADIFAARRNLRRIDDPNAPQSYVIDSPPAANTVLDNQGWRLWLDPNNGFLLTRIDWYMMANNRVINRVELTEFRPIEGGISAPVKAVLTQFDSNPGSKTFGKATEVWKYVVELERSRWNSDIDPHNFIPKFPEGTRIIDDR